MFSQPAEKISKEGRFLPYGAFLLVCLAFEMVVEQTLREEPARAAGW